jgi:hypothetical protein
MEIKSRADPRYHIARARVHYRRRAGARGAIVISNRDIAAKDRVAARTAKRISAALNRMARDLPESVAAQAALADVIAELTRLEPWFLGLIFEDGDIREAYDAAVAERPATPTARPV